MDERTDAADLDIYAGGTVRLIGVDQRSYVHAHLMLHTSR